MRRPRTARLARPLRDVHLRVRVHQVRAQRHEALLVQRLRQQVRRLRVARQGSSEQPSGRAGPSKPRQGAMKDLVDVASFGATASEMSVKKQADIVSCDQLAYVT